jgi:acyl dehydratase
MTIDSFTVPIGERYFEDYEPGRVYEFGSITVNKDEIIEFAERYDPQVFHVNPDLARKSVFGGLIASGWHTAALAMRLLVDHFISHVAALGSPGSDELRWLKPVRPGDTLSVRVTVVETRRLKSKPDRGVVRSFVEVLNQDHEVVMTRIAISIILARDNPELEM